MELLLNLLQAFQHCYSVHRDGNYLTLSAKGQAVSIHFEQGVFSICDRVQDDEMHLSFTDPGHVLPFIICQLQLDPQLPDYRSFCEQQAAHYHALVADVPINSPYYQRYLDEKTGYFTFWGDEHTGWSLNSLGEPERWAPGGVFVEIATGHIFQAVGGTEYDGATGFKQVWFSPPISFLERLRVDEAFHDELEARDMLEEFYESQEVVDSWYRVFTLDGRCLDEGHPIKFTHDLFMLGGFRELARRCAERFYYNPSFMTPDGSPHPWPLKIILLQGDGSQRVEVGSFVVSMALMPMFTAVPLEETQEVQP